MKSFAVYDHAVQERIPLGRYVIGVPTLFAPSRDVNAPVFWFNLPSRRASLAPMAKPNVSPSSALTATAYS